MSAEVVEFPVKDILALPSNVDAEQALLGSLLFDNSAAEHLPLSFGAGAFYEPFHARLYAAIEDHIRKGQLAEPIVLLERFRRDPAFEELGGIRYLAMLVDAAPPPHKAGEYARVIQDNSLRRGLVRASDLTRSEAMDSPETARDVLEAAEGRLFGLAESGASETGFVDFGTALHGAVEMASEAFGRDGKLSGVATGLVDIDQKLGGLHPSDLIIIAARPSMGKTALALNIAFNAARNHAYEIKPDGTKKTTKGAIVGFYSLEMSAEQLSTRLLAEVSGVPSDRIRKGQITAPEFAMIRDAATDIHSAPLHIDDTGGLRIDKLCSRARRLKRQVGLDLIVVDYLQLVRPYNSGKGGNRVEEVTEITQALKALAKELNVPVVACAQLSRQVEQREDKRPQLSDLRESGSIEQDADVVMSIFRESYYLGRTEPKEGTAEHVTWQDEMARCAGTAEIIIGKQRHGPIGTVRLSYQDELTKFGNLAGEGRFDVGSPRTPYRDD